MKKYTFRGKTYIAKRGECGCLGCAFNDGISDICKRFEISTRAPKCKTNGLIFIEKPKETMAYKEHTRKEIENNGEALEPVMAKGERMANSIMGFNSSKEKLVTLKDGSGRTLNPIMGSYSYKCEPRKTLIDTFTETNAILADLPFVLKSSKFIVSLLENDILEPSVNPKIHDSIESAEKEAERLCRLHNQEFVVLKVTASFKPQEPKKEVFA